MSEFKPGDNVLVLVKIKSVVETADGVHYEVHALDDASQWILDIGELDVFDPVTRLSGQDIDRRTAMEMEAKNG